MIARDLTEKLVHPLGVSLTLKGNPGELDVHVENRYLVEHENDDDIPTESSTFRTIERAKAVALQKLAYGYRSRVLDLVTGAQVFPPEQPDTDLP